MAMSEKKRAKLKKRLPRTPMRSKVVTKHMTPREAAQRFADDFEKRRNGG